MGDTSFDLDLMASSLSADSGDVAVLMKALVTRLSGALGPRLSVKRAGGILRRSDAIESVSIDLGEDQLEAAVEKGSLVCTAARTSGGIRIRSERLATDEWIRRLLTSLKVEAASSEATRLALESLVIGGDPS